MMIFHKVVNRSFLCVDKWAPSVLSNLIVVVVVVVVVVIIIIIIISSIYFSTSINPCTSILLTYKPLHVCMLLTSTHKTMEIPLLTSAFISFRYLPNPHATLEALFHPRATSLPGHIQAVYVQNIAKLYACLLKTAEEEVCSVNPFHS